jgi:hypothetical protein
MKKYINISIVVLCALLLAPATIRAEEMNANVKVNATYDLNNDGVVDGADTGMVLSAWGRCPTKIGERPACKEDINKDGVINQTDLNILFRNWTKYPDKKSDDQSVKPAERIDDKDKGDKKEDRDRDNDRDRVFSLKMNLETIVNRLLAGVDRLDNIIARIESRNEKLKTSGMDVGVSQGFVAQAKAEITAAKADIASLPKTFGDATAELVATTNAKISMSVSANAQSKAKFTSVREKIKSAKTHLQNAHQFLVRAVLSIKVTTSLQADTNR